MKRYIIVLMSVVFVSSLYPQFFTGSSSSSTTSIFGSNFGTAASTRSYTAGQSGTTNLSLAIEIGSGGEVINLNPDEYIVKAGDQFFIRYMAERVLTTVFPTGVLSLYPFAKDVQAVGKTISEVYKEVYSNLPPEVSRESLFVEFYQIAPTSYYVMGAVNFSGQYYVNGTINLLSAIKVAGDSYYSASRLVKIIRNGVEKTYNLNDIYMNNDSSECNPIIQNDDIILVNFAEKFARVFVNSSEVESTELFGDEEVKVSDIFERFADKVSKAKITVVTICRDGKYIVADMNFVIKHGDNVHLSINDLNVYVTGNVAVPGTYPYNGVRDVNYYIAQAGGIGPVGSTRRILIIDSKGKYRSYDGQNIVPGDIIYIPETWRNIMSSYLTPIGSLLSVITSILILSSRF